MSKKVLAVLSEYGYWGEELLGPMENLEGAGYVLPIKTPYPPARSVQPLSNRKRQP